MEYGNLQYILFNLGRALQDLYIAEKGGGGSESAELQKRIKEGLQILRFMGIGLEAEMVFDIEAGEGREQLFVAGADWTGSQDESGEPDNTVELKVGLVLLKNEGGEVVERGDVTAVIVSEPELGGDDFEGLPPEKNPPLPMPDEPLTAADWRFLWELGVVAPPERQSEETPNPHMIKDAAISLALNLQSCYIEEKLGEKRKAAILRKNASASMDFLHSRGIQINITVQNTYPRENEYQNKLEIHSSWPPEEDTETKFHLCLDFGLTISEGGKKIMPGDISVMLHEAYTNGDAAEPDEDAQNAQNNIKNSRLISPEDSRKLLRDIFGSDPPTGEPA